MRNAQLDLVRRPEPLAPKQRSWAHASLDDPAARPRAADPPRPRPERPLPPRPWRVTGGVRGGAVEGRVTATAAACACACASLRALEPSLSEETEEGEARLIMSGCPSPAHQHPRLARNRFLEVLVS